MQVKSHSDPISRMRDKWGCGGGLGERQGEESHGRPQEVIIVLDHLGIEDCG